MICYLQFRTVWKGFHYVFLRDTIRVDFYRLPALSLLVHILFASHCPHYFHCLPPSSLFLSLSFFYLSAVVEHEWPFRTDEVCSNCSDTSWEVEWLVFSLIFSCCFFNFLWFSAELTQQAAVWLLPSIVLQMLLFSAPRLRKETACCFPVLQLLNSRCLTCCV